MEEWRLYGNYKISNLGKVYSIKTNKILKTYTDRYGYEYVGLRINNTSKFKKVHRLVAELFLPEYTEDLQVNHKDNNKVNNKVSNLEMCTNIYNCNYGSRKNALSKKVIQMTLEGDFIKEWESTREIERILGFSNTNISACCRGYLKDYKSNKIYPVIQAYNYKWKYK